MARRSLKSIRKKSEQLKKKAEADKMKSYEETRKKYDEALSKKNFTAVKKVQAIPKQDKHKPLVWKSVIPEDYIESLGEYKIRKFLLENNIKFGKEASFEYLPNLRFDFYLPKLRTCIEFDGIQHYQYVDKFDNGDFSKLDLRKINDSRKTKFCHRWDITLIRIPYYKQNQLKEILSKHLLNNLIPA